MTPEIRVIRMRGTTGLTANIYVLSDGDKIHLVDAGWPGRADDHFLDIILDLILDEWDRLVPEASA